MPRLPKKEEEDMSEEERKKLAGLTGLCEEDVKREEEMLCRMGELLAQMVKIIDMGKEAEKFLPTNNLPLREDEVIFWENPRELLSGVKTLRDGCPQVPRTIA